MVSRRFNMAITKRRTGEENGMENGMETLTALLDAH